MKRKRRLWFTKYQAQKHGAFRRGIPFRLAPWQWWRIWPESGHWHERGSRTGQYVMARFGDRGAYEVGNVRIITNAENGMEANRVGSYAWSPEARAERDARQRLRKKGIVKRDGTLRRWPKSI